MLYRGSLMYIINYSAAKTNRPALSPLTNSAEPFIQSQVLRISEQADELKSTGETRELYHITSVSNLLLALFGKWIQFISTPDVY